MEKAKLKKNIHFTNEEEIFVAKMISDGADYNKVLQWHMKRFGRPMHKSKFYAHRKKAANTLAESHEKKTTHSYTEDINNDLLIDDLNERLEELDFFENEL